MVSTRKMRRREFLRRSALGAAGTAAVGAWGPGLAARAEASPRGSVRQTIRAGRREPLAPGLVEAGPELALPVGFSYVTLGRFGDAMSDGYVTPPIHDGMGVFDNPGGGYRVIRNHELGDSNDIPGGSVFGDPATAWDQGAPGCTVTLVVDTDGNLVSDWISANGTDSNCSGAETPWGTWLSSEETTVGPGDGWKKPHGYMFEIDPQLDEPVLVKPIKAMGRFVHEAAAVDPETSVVYLTEDDNPDCFYRYIPDVPGDLAKGGVLQGLRIKDQHGYNTVTGQTVGEVLPVDWVTIDDPDPADAADNPRAVLRQARMKGAARFMSGEGATWRDDHVVFDSSDGGDFGHGQIWKYTSTTKRGKLAEEGELTLLFESTDKKVLDLPDNLALSPGGGIVIAEDGDDRTNALRAFLPDDETMITIGQNLVPVRRQLIDASGKLYDPYVPDDDFGPGDGLGHSEFAGPRFSPDGKWLFVNIQVPGITCAITGDWDSIGL
jgi:secreted PhoX family phosphatase